MRIHDPEHIGCYAGWRRYTNNPQIDERIGTVCDPFVLMQGQEFRMYYTHVFEKKILTAMSADGLEFKAFTDYYISDEDIEGNGGRALDFYYGNGGDYGYALLRRPNLEWETTVCQPTVLKRGDTYHLWYVGKHFDAARKCYVTAKIGHAVSKSGQNWIADEKPCLVPEFLWEQNAVLFPSVQYDEKTSLFQMWYSAGDIDEPDKIGYAQSRDGIVWEKKRQPIFFADHTLVEERDRVNAAHILKENGWYYMFYTGWQDAYKARICIARSRDGISGWEKHPQNPVVTWGQFGTWDCETASHPFPLHLDGKWLCYYTGRNGFEQRIGVLIHNGDDLGFPGGEE